MRKLFCFLLVAIIVLTVGNAYAGYNGSDPYKTASYKTWVVALGDSSGVTNRKVYSTTEITTNDLIIEVMITPTVQGRGAVVGLYDTTDGLEAAANMITELETSADEETMIFEFPYPIKIDNQLILVAEMDCVITIIYEDK